MHQILIKEHFLWKKFIKTKVTQRAIDNLFQNYWKRRSVFFCSVHATAGLNPVFVIHAQLCLHLSAKQNCVENIIQCTITIMKTMLQNSRPAQAFSLHQRQSRQYQNKKECQSLFFLHSFTCLLLLFFLCFFLFGKAWRLPSGVVKSKCI